MLTGEGSEEIAVEAMKKGAADYLVKTSLSRIRLHHAVKSALERAEMLQTIDRQREELLCAERQRVMIESLGAACHHLSQPATAIVACLDILKNSDQSSNMREVIASCIEAAERMSDVFRRLQAVTEYRTEPYLQTGDKESPHPEERIVRI
jgi:FixJ family two-component response regulator